MRALTLKGPLWALGLITGYPVAVMRTPSVMALLLPGFGPLGRPGKDRMTGPLQGLDAALRGLAGSTDESIDPKLGLTMQRHFGGFVAKINGVGTYNLRGA